MRYLSTRGHAPALAFDDLLLTGLARDGGLYVPAEWPNFTLADWRALQGLSYSELAVRLLAPYTGKTLLEADIAAIVESAYAGFRHTAVAPLKQLDSGGYLMELFHGPTLAFKDYALQLLGRLFDRLLIRRGQRITILGATSGDTGSAAIEAFRDRASADIFILYPHGRVSEVQRRQMTGVPSQNVRAIAIEGSFDDCQDIVKRLFSDLAFRDTAQLSAANSINWARIAAQIVYYVYAALQLGAPDRPVNFAVPTGNFGNVFAAYCAKRMGLPIERLVIGTNRNDILTRFFTSGDMSIQGVEASLSPSMDIQVSSNFERLLFDLLERDGAEVARRMAEFRETGRLTLEKDRLERAQQIFSATRLSDAETLSGIRQIYEETGEILDPHSAIAVGGMKRLRGAGPDPMVALACAHPAKFPTAIQRALGFSVPLPPHLASLMSAPERLTLLPAHPQAVRDFIAAELCLGVIA